jgi:hypothetical protein
MFHGRWRTRDGRDDRTDPAHARHRAGLRACGTAGVWAFRQACSQRHQVRDAVSYRRRFRPADALPPVARHHRRAPVLAPSVGYSPLAAGPPHRGLSRGSKAAKADDIYRGYPRGELAGGRRTPHGSADWATRFLIKPSAMFCAAAAYRQRRSASARPRGQNSFGFTLRCWRVPTSSQWRF